MSGVYLLATYGDADGATVNANIEYKVSTASSWTVKDAAVSDAASGKQAAWQLPSSVTSGLADGTLVEWAAQDVDRHPGQWRYHLRPVRRPGRTPCFFAVYPDKPYAPDAGGELRPATSCR